MWISPFSFVTLEKERTVIDYLTVGVVEIESDWLKGTIFLLQGFTNPH